MSDQSTDHNTDASTVERTKVVQTTVSEPGHTSVVPKHTLATRIVWYLAGILLILLAFRFGLALMAANPANPFAHFIYAASYPFVAPFFGLFGYHLVYGVSQLEIYTLVAMAVYAVIAWAIDRLLNIIWP